MQAIQPQITPKERGAEILKKGLSHLHEALADYMLMNPGHTYAQMGMWFGYNPSWLCRVVKSDMFQAYLSKRRDVICANIAQDMPARLEAAAHLATEKLVEMLPSITDPEVAIDAFDKILHRAGYAPNTAKAGSLLVQNQQNNNFFLSREELTLVQGTLIEHHKTPAPAALPEPREVVESGDEMPAT